MLGYILSKLNLLILVTAIFAIIGFFAIGLADITKVNEAKELAFLINEKTFALVSASAYCLSDSHIVSDNLSVAGGRFYYVIAISKEEVYIDGDPEPTNIVIFSVFPRDEIKRSVTDSGYTPKAIAAESFRTKAEVHLYSRTYNGTDYEGAFLEHAGTLDEPVFIDPQAITRGNGIEFIKEVELGKPKLYLIICNDAVCEANKTSVGDDLVRPPHDDVGFKC